MASMDDLLRSLLNPIYVAILGVLAALFLKWWTERPTREYERETKRRQFFKAFYDLRSMEKPEVSPEFDRRCQQLLRDTSCWMESHPTKGAGLAKGMAVWVAWFSGSLAITYLSAQLPKLSAEMRPDQQLLESTGLLVAGICASLPVYWIMLKALTDLFSKVAGFRWFRHLTEAKW
jgi:hypothetical protein